VKRDGRNHGFQRILLDSFPLTGLDIFFKSIGLPCFEGEYAHGEIFVQILPMPFQSAAALAKGQPFGIPRRLRGA